MPGGGRLRESRDPPGHPCTNISQAALAGLGDVRYDVHVREGGFDMQRLIFLMPWVIVACQPGQIAVDGLDDKPGDGWAEGPWEEWESGDDGAEDLSMWDDATLRIISPEGGTYVVADEDFEFAAVVEAPNGDVLPITDIEWISEMTSWSAIGDTFVDHSLQVGLHDITAVAKLPNDDVVRYTSGNVKVQNFGSGLYAGTFSVNGSFNAIQFGCIGSNVIAVEPHGEEGIGGGDCLVSLLGFGELPLSFIIELDIDPTNGDVTGTSGADLFGWFTFDFPTQGVLRPLDGGFDLTFAGDVPLMGPIDAWLTAERVSLDSVPDIP